MKYFFSLIASVFILCSFNSCKHSPVDKSLGDYLIIYQMGGFTGGTHGPYYLLTNTELKVDKTSGDFIPNPITTSKLNLVPESSTKFNSVRSLIKAIPGTLLMGSKTFGVMPGADMTTVIIQAHISGTDYTWGFENDLSSCSSEIRDYASAFSNL